MWLLAMMKVLVIINRITMRSTVLERRSEGCWLNRKSIAILVAVQWQLVVVSALQRIVLYGHLSLETALLIRTGFNDYFHLHCGSAAASSFRNDVASE